MDEESVRIQELKEENEDYQQKLHQAAEFGKMLLEENEELKTRLDEIMKEYDRKFEAAEQEKHTLQVKLDQKCSMEAWYNEEISHLKLQLADGHENLRETMEEEKQQEVNKLTRQIEELKTDLEQAAIVESQLKLKTIELEDLLKEQLTQTEADLHSRSFGTSDENSELQEEVAGLHCEVTSLKSQLIEKKSELNSVVSELDSFRARLHSRDEELEDIKCQFTSVNNTLEQARMEKLDLKCQLDALRMETSSHRKKGNSIFSELDDRRVDAENKLISLQRSCESLQEKYSVEKQQNNKYKRQISNLLLQMSSGRVDTEYVTNLESKLSQARQEVKTLMEEKAQLQDQQQTQMKLVSEFGQVKKNGDSDDYTQYLVTVIEGKEQELQKTKQELNYKTLQLLDEKNRSSTQDSKIIQIEAEKDKLRSHNMKMAAKLEELRMKYEPEAVKKSGVLVVKRTETIPIDEQEEVHITETSCIQNNTTINQSRISSKTGSEKIGSEKLPLAEMKENIQDESSLVSKCLKTKTVSISDEVEEHEIEKEQDCSRIVEKQKSKHKGRTLTAVKHISQDSSKPVKDVNECKSQ